jgi:hypothetical protein
MHPKEGADRVSREAIDKMRELRYADPATYSVHKLSSLFGTTPAFVQMVASLPKSATKAFRRREEARLEEAKASWGERKLMVRAIRQRRREFW